MLIALTVRPVSWILQTHRQTVRRTYLPKLKILARNNPHNHKITVAMHWLNFWFCYCVTLINIHVAYGAQNLSKHIIKFEILTTCSNSVNCDIKKLMKPTFLFIYIFIYIISWIFVYLMPRTRWTNVFRDRVAACPSPNKNPISGTRKSTGIALNALYVSPYALLQWGDRRHETEFG